MAFFKRLKFHAIKWPSFPNLEIKESILKSNIHVHDHVVI
uniref:Uncharacterized protein n=1 Tax=Arundo donax TaxID=35708 RepID=A0A0A9HL08_ARUDO